MAFTEDDFRIAFADYTAGRAISRPTVFAALSIAMAVMTDELMLNAWHQSIDQVNDFAAITAIRSALTREAGNGN